MGGTQVTKETKEPGTLTEDHLAQLAKQVAEQLVKTIDADFVLVGPVRWKLTDQINSHLVDYFQGPITDLAQQPIQTQLDLNQKISVAEALTIAAQHQMNSVLNWIIQYLQQEEIKNSHTIRHWLFQIFDRIVGRSNSANCRLVEEWKIKAIEFARKRQGKRQGKRQEERQKEANNQPLNLVKPPIEAQSNRLEIRSDLKFYHQHHLMAKLSPAEAIMIAVWNRLDLVLGWIIHYLRMNPSRKDKVSLSHWLIFRFNRQECPDPQVVKLIEQWADKAVEYIQEREQKLADQTNESDQSNQPKTMDPLYLSTRSKLVAMGLNQEDFGLHTAFHPILTETQKNFIENLSVDDDETSDKNDQCHCYYDHDGNLRPYYACYYRHKMSNGTYSCRYYNKNLSVENEQQKDHNTDRFQCFDDEYCKCGYCSDSDSESDHGDYCHQNDLCPKDGDIDDLIVDTLQQANHGCIQYHQCPDKVIWANQVLVPLPDFKYPNVPDPQSAEARLLRAIHRIQSQRGYDYSLPAKDWYFKLADLIEPADLPVLNLKYQGMLTHLRDREKQVPPVRRDPLALNHLKTLNPEEIRGILGQIPHWNQSSALIPLIEDQLKKYEPQAELLILTLMRELSKQIETGSVSAAESIETGLVTWYIYALAHVEKRKNPE